MIQSIILEWLFLTVQVTSKVRIHNLRANTAFSEIMVKELYTRFLQGVEGCCVNVSLACVGRNNLLEFSPNLPRRHPGPELEVAAIKARSYKAIAGESSHSTNGVRPRRATRVR
jgi:hypothetical protein